MVDLTKLIIQPVALRNAGIGAITATPDVETGWLGSYPKPTTSATLMVEVTKDDLSPMAGLTVTANIYNAQDGTLWKTLTLHESTLTPGIYRNSFQITRNDSLGSYPVHVVATRGLLTRATFDGYVSVYAGTPMNISFR